MSDAPPIFVFGSNLAGRHGKGAALWARQHRGAIYGQGVGRQGNSYAIPIKGAEKTGPLSVLPIMTINIHCGIFLNYAREHPDERFELTPVGCGLGGFTPEQIAPFFADAPPNVALPQVFLDVLAKSSGETHGQDRP